MTLEVGRRSKKSIIDTFDQEVTEIAVVATLDTTTLTLRFVWEASGKIVTRNSAPIAHHVIDYQEEDV